MFVIVFYKDCYERWHNDHLTTSGGLHLYMTIFQDVITTIKPHLRVIRQSKQSIAAFRKTNLTAPIQTEMCDDQIWRSTSP